METKKTIYEKKKKKKNLLGSITADLETKHNLENTAIETGKDAVVGVLGGGIIGAAIGRASLLIGVAVTAIGHYTQSRLASIFGVGMMASNGFQKSDNSVNGTGSIVDDAKERVLTFKDNFSQKLYLDKIKKPAKEKETNNSINKLLKSSAETKLLPAKTAATGEEEKPVGDVQYFKYPHAEEIEKEQHLTALDHVEDLLHKSAAKYQEESGTSGFGEEEGKTPDLDPEEKNY